MAHVEKGGDIVILGVYAENPTVNMYYLGEHELNMFGSMMYRREDYLEAVKMIDLGKIKTAPLISKHFEFNSYLKAYQYIEEQGDLALKVMIKM
jgi:L-iditol 2-dehydrogenase/threonine 3-dehydrogenase